MDVELFPCYSWKLVSFLNSKGFYYKLVGLHPETHKKFWIFIRNQQLNEMLTEWKETNPN